MSRRLIKSARTTALDDMKFVGEFKSGAGKKIKVEFDVPDDSEEINVQIVRSDLIQTSAVVQLPIGNPAVVQLPITNPDITQHSEAHPAITQHAEANSVVVQASTPEANQAVVSTSTNPALTSSNVVVSPPKVEPNWKISVRISDDKFIWMNVKPSSTVKDVKALIWFDEGIADTQQQLVFEDKTLRNIRTLSSYNIRDGSRLNLIRLRNLMIISIKMITTKIFTLVVDPNDTTDDVKRMIQRIEGIPPDRQRLIFAGKLLGSGTKLSDCKITPNSLIHLVTSFR